MGRCAANSMVSAVASVVPLDETSDGCSHRTCLVAGGCLHARHTRPSNGSSAFLPEPGGYLARRQRPTGGARVRGDLAHAAGFTHVSSSPTGNRTTRLLLAGHEGGRTVVAPGLSKTRAHPVHPRQLLGPTPRW